MDKVSSRSWKNTKQVQ